MKHTFKKLKRYYDMFGARGIVFYLKTIFLTEPEEVCVNTSHCREPVFLRLKSSDVGAFQQVFLNQEYDFETSVVPKVILDAGANIGLASIYFANKFPDAVVLAIEPEISNFSLLTKNTARYKNIIPIQAALWCDNSSIQLVNPGLGKWGFQTHSNGDGKNICHDVPAMTVDRIMSDHGIDYIDIAKIDIEGAEKEVFEDASKWIQRVGILIVELHEHIKPGCNRSFYNATNNFSSEWMLGENVYLSLEKREKASD